ncbi:Flp family type IVb pilin [Geodermatophilus sp. SYSU D00691]
MNPFATFATLVSLASDRLRREEKGATAVEYGLMVALIAAVIIGAVILLGNNLDGIFGDVAGEIGGAAGGDAG